MTTLSDCCGAYMDSDFMICSKCKEHSEPQMCCDSCGEPMDETETNYGTEDILTCLNCWNDLQNESGKFLMPLI